MRNLLLFFALFAFASSAVAPITGKEAFAQMHKRYSGKWYKTFTFNQTTEVYRNDSLKKTETWYEYIQFPQNFRIDFGNRDSGNAVIFKNDSSYVFKNSKKIRTSYSPNDLLFLLGGMYFYPLDESISKMASFGFDVNTFHEDTWKGEEVYVFGAAKKGDTTNQVWFDKKNYNLVRMLKYENNRKEEALLENHVKLKGGFSETLVYFYINDKLIQVEKYHDLKGDVKIHPEIFNTDSFRKTVQ